MSFEIYTINDVERICIPANLSLRIKQRMLDVYKPNRLHIKFIWKLKQLFTFVDFPGLRSSVVAQPSSRLEYFDWSGWLKEVALLTDKPRLLPAFYFPPHLRRKKYSCLLFDDSGESITYGKVAWGDEDKKKIIQERVAATSYTQIAPKMFKAPRLFYSGKYTEQPYNLFDPLPLPIRSFPNKWNNLHQRVWIELTSNTQRNLKATIVPWWEKVLSLPANWQVAIQQLETAPANQLKFSFAHGDFTSWNMCMINNQTYLFDWENFEVDAPLWLDLFYYIFTQEFYVRKSRNYKHILSSICSVMNQSTISWSQYDLLLATIYLRVQNHDIEYIPILDNIAAELTK